MDFITSLSGSSLVKWMTSFIQILFNRTDIHESGFSSLLLTLIHGFDCLNQSIETTCVSTSNINPVTLFNNKQSRLMIAELCFDAMTNKESYIIKDLEWVQSYFIKTLASIDFNDSLSHPRL